MLKSLALAATFFAGAEALKADSRLGMSLLSKSRKLEDADEEYDYTYVANYSIKFQGCHHVSQWNLDADDGDENVRIQTKRLIRFRLCPTGSCTNDKTAGCSSGYGDYIVDMDTFLYSYLTDKQEQEEYNCEYAAENTCGCGADDVDDEDTCLANCYANNGMDYCIANDDDAAQFDVSAYAYCSQADFGRRRLDQGDVAYYIGASCADQGGEVHLGLFVDDTCSEQSSTSYYSLTGSELPYSDESLVSDSCISCLESNANQNNNGDDVYDADQVKEMCETLYTYAGKCETYMGIDYINENACSYIEGIKIIRDDGVIRTSATRKSKGAAVAIGLFATTAILLGAYVYYLRTKLGRAKINLTND